MLIWAIIYGIFTLAILYSQCRIQKSNFRLALYDKRYAVFLSAMEYISEIVTKPHVDDAPMKLLRSSKDKEFLFKPKVGKYIESLYKQGIDLQEVRSLMVEEKDPDRRRELSVKMLSLNEWFARQFEECKKTFWKYLAIMSK